MTSARWPRLKALFEVAVEQPADQRAAFLASATAGDDELRREVESLLASDAEDASLLHGLTPGTIADFVAAEMSHLAADGPMRSLGPYRLQSLVGAGGMGEVYRARDATLERDVAIKILPPAFTSDADRLARFEREARLLAALNHPNICTIYGLEEHDGLRCLVLEFVDGESLAQLIAEPARQYPNASRLPVDAAIGIARQICEALEAAHEKGIIHRDLKPANINITPDGLVKVLDFGLAKNVTGEGTGQDLTRSPAGAGDPVDPIVLGTAAYMSPEQARGDTLDKRSDIWAFGCVLYEMLAGRAAFGGHTSADTIAKILEREPDWSALPADTPDAVRRILIRCLSKDPRQRLRDIGDVRIEIDGVEEKVPGVAAATLPTPVGRSWTIVLPWVALAALAFAIGVREFVRRAAPMANPLVDAQLVPVTDWPGAEEGAVISHDGRFVAFLSDRDGEFDVWVSQLGTGSFSNLTRGTPALAPAGSIVRKLAFSGDGAEIWFNAGDRQPSRVVPLTGGASRVFLGADTNTPMWSPRGERLIFVGKPLDGADPMYVADRNAADPRELVPPQAGMKRNNPVWSPDGEWIYFVSGSEPQDEMDINVWRVRAAGGTPEQLTDRHGAINFVAAVDARTLLYTARDEDGGGPWLWALDIPTRDVRRIGPGIHRYTSIAASRDGRRLVATIANPSATLWRVPVLDRPAEEREAEPYPLPVPAGQSLAPRFGPTSLFYLSAHGTSDGLWKVERDTATEVWRNVNGVMFEPPAVSPDGQRVAMVVRQAGKRQLKVASADGTSPRTLAPAIAIEGAAFQGAADWSPDGTAIVTGGRDAKGPALFIVPVDGGVPARVREGKFVNPVWSPRGDLIVFGGRSLIGRVTLLAIHADGTVVDLPEIATRPGGYRFLADGSGLVYLPAIHALDFRVLDFATMKSRPLTRLSNAGVIRTFDLTRDGKYIVFDRTRENSDVVMIDLPRR